MSNDLTALNPARLIIILGVPWEILRLNYLCSTTHRGLLFRTVLLRFNKRKLGGFF